MLYVCACDMLLCLNIMFSRFIHDDDEYTYSMFFFTALEYSIVWNEYTLFVYPSSCLRMFGVISKFYLF